MNSIVTILALVATVSVQAAPLPNGAISHWREPITLGDFPSNIEHQWSQLALSAPRMTEWQQLLEVNRIFNQVTKVSDFRKWGRKDYWATPAEFLRTNGGDCEDFAIAKYFALLALGFSENQLRIGVSKVYNPQRHTIESHAVLLFTQAHLEDWLVLDNLFQALQPLRTRSDIALSYVMSRDVFWEVSNQALLESSPSGVWDSWQAVQRRINKI